MSSTLTESGINTQANSSKADRKTSKTGDAFLAPVAEFFSELSRHRQVMLGAVIAVLVVGAGVAYWSSRTSSRNAAAEGALFDAKKTLDTELKKVAAELAPAQAKPAKPAMPTEKDAPVPGVESILYARFDVVQKFPEAVKKLENVTQSHSGTVAAFEAALALGDLYFDHGQAEKALPWYTKAVDAAPGTFHRGLALYSLGYAQENSGKAADALKTYEKALGAGAADLKGDLLLATARTQAALNDQAKARSTYDQIISQMPDTEYAKTARVLKNELH